MSVFNKYKYWIHSAKYNVIQKFAVLSIAIVSFMLLARMLGPEGYGIWGLFMVISAITETARNSLIRNAYIWFSHQNPEEEHGKLQAAAFLLSAMMSTLVALVYFFMSGFIADALNSPGLSLMLKIYALSLLITVLFSHAETILNAKMDFRGICWMNCVRQCIFLLCVLFFYISKFEITLFLLSLFYLGSILFGSLVGVLMAKSYLHWQYKGYQAWLPKLWHFGRFVFGNNIFSQLFRSTDVITASVLFGPGISAYYNASQRISNLVDMPSAVLADIMFPRVAKFDVTDKQSVKNIYEKAVGATMIFSIPALLIILVFPELILRILAGEQFVYAAPILRITAFFGFILPFLKQFGTVIDGTGSPRVNFRLMFFGFVINIFIILLFSKLWGVIGTAIGTATTYFILFVISQIILNKKFGITLSGVFKNIAAFYAEIFQLFKLFFRKLVTTKA